MLRNGSWAGSQAGSLPRERNDGWTLWSRFDSCRRDYKESRRLARRRFARADSCGTDSWGAERVADPFVRATVEHHRVEAAARPGSLAERIQQVALRGAPQARLLAVADARCGTAEGAG